MQISRLPLPRSLKWDEALTVLKAHRQDRAEASGCAQNLERFSAENIAANESIEALISIGLDLGQDIRKAVNCSRLPRLLGRRLRRNTVPGWGVGVVTAVDLDTAMVTIDSAT